MFFRVENLGPLREAEVDLSKSLIVLTGPNNSGKTFLAWSVYGLYREPTAREVFGPLVREILASPTQDVDFGRISELWPAILDAAGRRLAERLHLCFAAVRETFATANITLRAAPAEPERHEDWSLRGLGSNGISCRISIGARVAVEFRDARDPDSDEPIKFTEIPEDAHEDLFRRLERDFSWIVLRSCWPRCTLLPAERTAVDLFAKELSSRRVEMLNEVVEAELDGGADLQALTRSMGRYPWPIQDSLRVANELGLLSRFESKFADLAAEVEVLLGGALGLSEQGEFQFAPKGAATKPIGIHLTSSVVKSLVSLVFFLRHRAREGDLLIIDEPELNLHPDNQRKVTRILAKIINRGIHVIMSTHSDYVIRELDHLIMLSNLSAEEATELGYDPGCALPPEQVGVYLFNDHTAEPVEVDEMGFSVRTIDDENRKINEISQRLYAKLSE